VPDVVAAADAIRAALDAGDETQRRAVIDAAAEKRRAAALYNRDASSLALEHMRARDWRTRLRRSASAWLAKYGTRAGAYLDSAPFGPRAAAKQGADGIY
jgi:3-(3-hydroxy-phenyl)propionate hydroxylase